MSWWASFAGSMGEGFARVFVLVDWLDGWVVVVFVCLVFVCLVLVCLVLVCLAFSFVCRSVSWWPRVVFD